MNAVSGLHHVTAIAGGAQSNLDFYAGVLGLRLVKKTVNFDDPGTYHFYFGDRTGRPGTIMTSFPFAGARPGRAGPGMASAVAFSVPADSLDSWRRHLSGCGVDVSGAETRLESRLIRLRDPDGMEIELVEEGDAAASAPSAEGPPPITALHGVTLWLPEPAASIRVLTDVLGYRPAGEEGVRLRFRVPGARATAIDVRRDAAALGAVPGAGTVHHIAFRAPDAETQQAWRGRLATAGLSVTPVIDRQYFQSIYFHEPGGVLFEIATDPPGFALDESESALGTALKLPDRYEPERAEIERRLPSVAAPNGGGKGAHERSA